jgi:hypothetical protein
VIVLAVMLVGLRTAQAAETTLTLACKGKETSRGGARTSSEVINIGIIVDLHKKTVIGLSDSPLTIDKLAETEIRFSGTQAAWITDGYLDRVTGSLFAISSKLGDPKVTRSYDLQCRPTQQMF